MQKILSAILVGTAILASNHAASATEQRTVVQRSDVRSEAANLEIMVATHSDSWEVHRTLNDFLYTIASDPKRLAREEIVIDDALRFYQDLVRREPNNFKNYYWLGRTYDLREVVLSGPGIEAYDSAIAIAKEEGINRLQPELYQEILETRCRGPPLYRTPLIDRRTRTGARLPSPPYQSDDVYVNETLNYFSELIRHNERDNLEAYINIGYIHWGRGNIQTANQWYFRCIERIQHFGLEDDPHCEILLRVARANLRANGAL